MSNESTLSRQPSGVPVGGQFAGTVKPETTTALAPVHPAPRKSSNGVFDVVDTVSERLASDEHITRTMIHMGGKPDAKAQANLVGLRMERAEQPDPKGPPSTRYFILRDQPVLDGNQIKNPEQNFDNGTGENGQPNVTFDFTGKGASIWKGFTRKLAQRGQEPRRVGVVGGDAICGVPLSELRDAWENR